MDFIAGPAVHRVLCADCGTFPRCLQFEPHSSFGLPRYTYRAQFRESLRCLLEEYVSPQSTSFSVFFFIISFLVSISRKESQNKVRLISSSLFCPSILTSISLASVSFCRNCERFLSPPTSWTLAKPESSELLAICLRKLKGLNKVRLTEAHFIWTEPHSKRLRVSMTIQKEVPAPVFFPMKISFNLLL